MGRVFEHHQSTGHDKGAVCFITVTGFLDGPGRAWLAQYGDGAAHVTGAGGKVAVARRAPSRAITRAEATVAGSTGDGVPQVP